MRAANYDSASWMKRELRDSSSLVKPRRRRPRHEARVEVPTTAISARSSGTGQSPRISPDQNLNTLRIARILKANRNTLESKFKLTRFSQSPAPGGPRYRHIQTSSAMMSHQAHVRPRHPCLRLFHKNARRFLTKCVASLHAYSKPMCKTIK